MKATKSVEEMCQQIEQHKLMSSKDYAAMRGRWFRPERKEVSDAEEFRKWLVLNRYLTEFVANVVARGKAGQLVLNQYRLQDQMTSGPMAGAYLAHDALDRPVAIEVLSAESAADKAVLAGFQQAALKAMDVQHANVGRIVDTGEAHGFYYLVKEYYEGQTLEDILQKRGKIPYLQATRLMALALAGLEALHAKGVPAGDLKADCLQLAPLGKGAANQRTVKILHAGVRRRLFDETAIGRTIAIPQGIPDELELAKSGTFHFDDAGAANPAEDIFRLGCIFYRCVTGKAPFAERDLPQPKQPARPVAELAPEVPEMLCQIIEQMIDPDPAKRPQKAAHVAKSLRVFLAAEEHATEIKAEEHIIAPTHKPAEPAAGEPELEEEEEEEVEEQPATRRAARTKEPVTADEAYGKAAALWNEIKPDVRDLLFLAGGALGMLLIIFLGTLLTGINLVYIAGLLTGMAASYCVDVYLRWRRRQSGEAASGEAT
jgi:eukaryotic-like serine/threonine-protein kinase